MRPGRSSQRAERTASNRANTGSGAGCFRTVITAIEIAIRECAGLALLAVLVPVIGIACENADVARA